MLPNGMIQGALITGNTVVLKPTSEAPLTGLLLYQVFRDAGVPPAVSILAAHLPLFAR
jgi:1-pyrroline-5-carboxylate dehydrogenase